MGRVCGLTPSYRSNGYVEQKVFIHYTGSCEHGIFNDVSYASNGSDE